MAPAMAPSPKGGQAFWRRHRVKLGLSLVIAGAFVFTLQRGGLPLLPPSDALAEVRWPICFLYFLCMIVMHTLRAARWRHLLTAAGAEIPLRRVITVGFIGFAAILIMPLRAGEIVCPYMIRQKGKISMAAATGTVAAERIVDGLCVTLLLGVCLLLARPQSPLPDHIGKLPLPVAAVPFYAYLSLLMFVGAFTAMAMFYRWPRFARRLVGASLGVVSRRGAERVADFVEHTAEGLKFLPSFRHFGPFLAETALFNFLNALSLFTLAKACGIDSITMTQAYVVLGVLSLGVLMPAGPGLFGAFQASAYAALALYFSDEVVLGKGAVFVFLLYAIQAVWHVVTAAFSLWLEQGSAREVLDAEAS